MADSGFYNFTLGYYMPALPFVNCVMSLDFGYLDHYESIDSVHCSRIDPAIYSIDEAQPKDKPTVQVLSYSSHHDSDVRQWHVTQSGRDFTIESGEAYNFWRKFGFGTVCTGSLKEARKLKSECGVKSVIFIDEEFLKMRLEKIADEYGHWADTKVDFPSVETDLLHKNNNSYYRCLRLNKYVTEYQKWFYGYNTSDEIEKNNAAFGRLTNLN